jgi:predicted nuclease of predicted toxin-antitoxin system
MKLYLDQMFRLDLATLLRAEGHDVLCAFEAGQATADDTQILQLAINQGRVLITMDEHFGHWAILPLDKHPGVIRLKAHPTTTANIARLLLPFLTANHAEALSNHLVILSSRAQRWIRTSESA